jgi:type I restriction enzyme M protein
MFVQSERFVEAHGGQKTDISILGQESNPTTWRLAHMNLAIRGIEANLGAQPADTFLRNLHPDLKADYILANPPFNISDWSAALLADDVRWRFGTPPAGNANYAWIQHFIHHLAPPNGQGGGVAGFVMANGSLSTGTGGEGEIRQRIVEADLVDCIIALPAQLFLTTGIPACLWFLTRDKSGKNLKHGGRDRSRETLFIDARKLGSMQTRTLRVLTGGDDGETMLSGGIGDPKPDSDIGRIVYAFRQWRGEPAPDWWDEAEHGRWQYRDVPGFCKAETIESIGKHGFVLIPGRFVGAEEQEDDGEPFVEMYPRLLAELEERFGEGERLMGVVRGRLGVITHGG